jgi:L-lactate dehydrogenase complex protein LldF
MTHAQMADVLSATADGKKLPVDPQVLMTASRAWLRRRFIEADMGITGANFGIAETGSFFIVTNEGNGRLTASLPRVHVAMMGIERLLPTMESMPTMLQVLTRSGTGQRVTVYVSFFSGPRKPGELHGPEEQHLVLVDNGRSKLLGTEFAEALECIRCGACLNACPVYEKAGGHAYQAIYAGPIGKIVTPLYGKSPIANELPHASSLCGACKEACPVKIDIPRMLIRLRRDYKFAGEAGAMLTPAASIAARVLASPTLYRLAARTARIALAPWTRSNWIHRAPGPLAAWTLNRDLPALDARPFRARWKERLKSEI